MKIEVWKDTYSQNYDIDTFFKKASMYDLNNNTSFEAMGLPHKKNWKLFLLYIGDEIAGTSYVHDFSEYYPYSFRVGTRTCVLPEYREFKIPIRRGSLAQGIGLTAYTIKQQWDFALSEGAKTVLWTTNLEGCGGSIKMTNYLHKFQNRNKELYSFLENKYIYSTNQAVWNLHTGDILC